MKEDDLKVNQLIELVMEHDGQRVVVSSRIEDIGKEHLLIAAPIQHGIPLLLPLGSEIMVQLWYRDTLWGFNTIVVGRRFRPIPMWIIKKPAEIKELPQKRHSVRLNISLPIQFRYLDRNDDKVYKGLTVDISAGGVLFSSSQACESGERIKVELELNEQIKISAVALVVRSFNKDEDALRGYRVAVKFEDLTENQRDKIFRFIFDKQREWIRKGLLE